MRRAISTFCSRAIRTIASISVSKYVAACERVIEAAGLSHELHANGTNIQGDWDEVFCVVKRCHEVVHEMGAPRIHTNIKLGTRTYRRQTMKNTTGSRLRHAFLATTRCEPAARQQLTTALLALSARRADGWTWRLNA